MFKFHYKRLLKAIRQRTKNPYAYMIISGVGLLTLLLSRISPVLGDVLFFLIIVVTSVFIIFGLIGTPLTTQLSAFGYWSKADFKRTKLLFTVEAFVLPTVSVLTRLFSKHMTIVHEDIIDFFASLTGSNALLSIFLGLFCVSAALIINQKEQVYKPDRRW
jgi:hypothetical protein